MKTSYHKFISLRIIRQNCLYLNTFAARKALPLWLFDIYQRHIVPTIIVPVIYFLKQSEYCKGFQQLTIRLL